MAYLDTLAKWLSVVGQLDRAIQVQQQTVDHASENMLAEIQEFLELLKAKKD